MRGPKGARAWARPAAMMLLATMTMGASRSASAKDGEGSAPSVPGGAALASASPVIPGAQAGPGRRRVVKASAEARFFDASLRDYRDYAARSPIDMLTMVPLSARADVAKTLDLASFRAAVAWSLFFKGAFWTPGPIDRDQAFADYYNPAFDLALATKWRRADKVWTLVSATPLTGAEARGEPASVAPAWALTPRGSIAAGFARQRVPSLKQIQAASRSPGHDRDLPLERIIALRIDAAKSLPAAALSTLETGDAPTLVALGASHAGADAISRLPAVFRSGLVVFAAAPTAKGRVLVLGPGHGPGLLLLVLQGAAGEIVDVTALAVSATEPGSPA